MSNHFLILSKSSFIFLFSSQSLSNYGVKNKIKIFFLEQLLGSLIAVKGGK